MRWKVAFSWVFLAFASLGMGKLISDGYHTKFLATTMWFAAGTYFAAAWRIYKEAGLSHFNSQSGKFEPYLPKEIRLRVLGVFVNRALDLAAVGFLAQVYL